MQVSGHLLTFSSDMFSDHHTFLICSYYQSFVLGTITSSVPPYEKTGLRGFPTRSDTNRAVQPQVMARGLKFRI